MSEIISKNKKKIIWGCAIILALLLGCLIYWGYPCYEKNVDSPRACFEKSSNFFKKIIGGSSQSNLIYKTVEEVDEFVRFDMEIYDKISQNYWDKISDKDLSELFRFALIKALDVVPEKIILLTSDREGTAKMLASSMENLTETAQKNLALDVAVIALGNLQPTERSGLFSSQQETDLRNNVSNINLEKNLYKDLGIDEGSNVEEVNKAFENKKSELLASKAPNLKERLEEITYAREVLTNQDTKVLYDQSKIEPTVFKHIIKEKTLYFYWNKVSPTTLQEFGMGIINASTTPGLDTLIIDLRGNVGGSLDFANYFMGLFLGYNQYAFDLFHKGDYLVQRTTLEKISELDRYKEIAILTDNMTQSTAELIAAIFKRFRLAKIVGTQTRGWGTVENTFPIETVIDPKEKYSVFLVHSITLRDDNQPIEGRGIDPDLDTSKPNWQNKLPQYFQRQSLISALSIVATKPPMK